MSEVISLFLAIMGAFTVAFALVSVLLIAFYEIRHKENDPNEELYKTGYRDALAYMTYRGRECIDTMEKGDPRALGVAMMVGIAESRLKYENPDGTKKTT